MQTRTPKPFRLALFWLGLQTVWGALLGISLQARSSQLAGGDALIAYGHLAAIGATVAAVTQIAVGFWSDARRKRGSRRVEFYVAGTIGGAVAIAAFYGATTFAMLTLAYVALQLTLNLAIGPYQAILPDFHREEAARRRVVVAGRAAEHRQCDRRDRRKPDRKRARRRRRHRRAPGRYVRGDGSARPDVGDPRRAGARADAPDAGVRRLVRLARAGVRRFFHDGRVSVFLRQRRARIQRCSSRRSLPAI